MAGNASTLVEDFNGLCGQPDLHLFFDQLIGYGIVMPFHLDVVIDMDPSLFPLCVDIGLSGKGFERGSIQGLVEGLP